MRLQDSFGVRWRRRLGVRLGVFEQHAPRPLPNRDRRGGSLEGLPSISLVTPSFNQGVFIGDTVHSVLAQDYPCLQYVIQDGGSTDSTLEVLSRFPRRSFLLAVEDDAGQADAINRGFEKCDGDILGYLNSDDVLVGDTLLVVGQFFRDNPDIDVIYGNRLIVDSNGLMIGRWILPEHDEKLLYLVDYVPQETLFWRRRAWSSVGGHLDATMNFAIDWDLLLRLQKAGAKICHVPWLFGGFRVHALQKTSNDLENTGRREMSALRKRFGAGEAITLLQCRHILFLLKHLIADIRYMSSATNVKQGRSF